MREELLRRASMLLEQKGYSTYCCIGTRACFDLVARREGELFLVKVLENIDAFTREQARDLEKISSLFGAKSIILGNSTKEGRMRDGILYERQGTPAATLPTLAGIAEGEYPEERKFNVFAVAVDGQKLASARRKKGIGIAALAEASGISRSTLSRYERGETGASEESVLRLEDELGEGLRKPIDPFKPGRKPVYEKTAFSFLGFESVKAKSAPFDIAAREKRRLFAGEEADKRTLKKRAVIYSGISETLDSLPCFLLTESKANQIEGIPVIRLGELKRIRRAGELLKLLQERSE